jgi:metallo-beta-lactamase class B
MKKALILNMSLIFLLLAGKAQTAENGVKPSEDTVQFSKLATNVWMHTSYKNVEPWGLVFTNGLVIERDNFSLLVDTAWNIQQTTQIIEWAKIKLKKPIKASIHTHAHSDKMGGIVALHKAKISTYASSMSNELAPTHDLIPAKNDLDITSVGDQTLWEGLNVFYPGGGHTHDNIVVYDRESQIIFGGCLIRPGNSDSLGYTGDANIEHWSQAARNVANAFPEGSIVVPSHGEPGGREVLINTIEIAKPLN